MLLRIALAGAAVLALSACAAAPRRLAYDDAPVQIGPAPPPFDPALLPPNTAPGDCVVRTPAGWARCAPDHDEDRYASAARYRDGYAYERGYIYSAGYESAYDDAYAYNPAYAPDYAYGYRTAGRDADGFLVWPGKTPR